MAPDLRRVFVYSLALLLVSGASTPAFAFRYVNWNILNYPGTTSAVREPGYRAVLTDIQPDVLVVQEMQSQAGVNQFLANVLDVINPGQWVAVTFHNGPDTNNAMFYKPSVITMVDSTYLTTDLRDIAVYRFRVNGYTTPAAELSVFGMHLKASSGLANEHQRRLEAIVARNYANSLPAGTNFVYSGDMNVYSNTDSGYVIFLESEANNNGRAHDPLNAQGAWNNNGAYAAYHTQSTRTGTLTPSDGGATGGLDDRFDQVLFSASMDDFHGLDWIPGKYHPWGNDGNHFNKNINDAPIDPTITQAVADGLQRTSDHLPVVLEFAAPALSQVAETSLDFGTFIVGAAVPKQAIHVNNVANVPADGLDFSVSVPVGFFANAGPFVAKAGFPGVTDSVAIDNLTPAVLSGDLQVSSDDPETPVRLVALSGTALNHAVPSLTSDPYTFDRAVDWGVQPPGGFTDQTFAVYNPAASPAARLEVGTAVVNTTDGRFTLTAPPDEPLFVSADSVVFSVAFHDSDATQDSLYEAQIDIPVRDESGLPGSTDLGALHVHLSAIVGASPVAVEPTLPKHSGLALVSPNPSRGSLRMSLDLAHDADATVELFDVQGKKTASLASGFRGAGRYSLQWSAAHSRPAGVYFLRYDVDGLKGVKRVVLLP